MDPLAVTLGLILTTLIICHLLKYVFNKKNYPPGPVSLPIVGTSYVVKKYCSKYGGLHKALMELSKDYGTDILSLSMNGRYMVAIQGDTFLNELFSKDEFLGRPYSFFIKLRSLGTNKGITMTDGPFWHIQRTFAMKQLNKLGFGKEPMECHMLKEIQNFIDNLHMGGTNLYLKLSISKCILNVLWTLVAGSDFENGEVLDELLNLMLERSKAFDIAGGTISQYPWLRFIAPEASGYNIIKRMNEKMRNIITRTIDDHRATYSKDVTRDYIDCFLHEMNQAKDIDTTFTEDQLIMVCLDFFIAGSITVSSTLDFLLLHMLLRPDLQQKAYEEINSVLEPGKLSSLSHKNQMPFARAIIAESERFTPITPIVGPRRLLKDATLGGYALSKGTAVLINCLKSTCDSNKWDNPNEFSPMRFLNEDVKNENKKLFTFGKGKRRCPGASLAKSFIFLFFTSFLNNFKIENPTGKTMPTLKVVPGITYSPAPYELTLTPRNPLPNLA